MLRIRRFLGRSGRVALAVGGADQRLLDSEMFFRIQRAVRVLPTKYREPVVLKYLQELDNEQICRILGLSENALQVRLNRARKYLQEKLKDLIE